MSEQHPPQNTPAAEQQPGTLDPQTMRRELALKQAINGQLDELVRLASKRVSTLTPTSSNKLEESQLRNVLNVAQQSRAPEEVANFIRYQIGRKDDAWGKKANDIGHGVIRDIQQEVSKLADAVVVSLEEQNIDKPGEQRDKAYKRLMLLYLGYLNRTFYYAKNAKIFYSPDVSDGFADLKAIFAEGDNQ